MTTPDTAYRDPLEARARRRVKIKLGFATHLFIYVCVNLGLWLISTVSGTGRWHIFPLMGWGLGLAIHGLVTFIALQGDGLRGRMLDDEIRRLREREGGGQGGGR